MKIKTAEAKGLQLDWGLAKALELNPEISRPSPYDGSIAVLALPLPEGYPRHHKCGFFHTDPAVCMGLIERYGIASTRKTFSLGHFWECRVLDVGSESHYIVAHGKTLPEAVARCVIAMRLGEYFECPNELGVMS